ncbi:MAG TPA: plastocyanin/azurin family copper-binding protein [Cyclobacteriaceae bacterium]
MKRIVILMVSGCLLLTSFSEKRLPVIHVVNMEGMRFSPDRLEIKAGESVRWINRSSSAHNVIANDKRFKSKMLPDEGDQFEYKFERAGVVHYYCQPHRMMGMRGVIVVNK